MKNLNTTSYPFVLLMIVLCLLSNGVTAQSTFSRETTSLYQKENILRSSNPAINLNLHNVSLREALRRIADQAEAGLYYNSVILPSKKVNLNLQGVRLGKALRMVLSGTSLKAVTSGRNIILQEKEKVVKPKKKVIPVAVQETVEGTVTDATSGETLPGVNILVIGTNTGTSTSANGKYELNVESLQDTLRFSYIGYKIREVPIKGRTKIDVTLTTATTGLEELVVTGLASSTKRENLANDVTKINSKELTETVAPTTVGDALSGKIPGVNIKSTGGAPGGGFNIQMRGISTIGAGDSQPLFIVDGVYVNNSSIPSGRSVVSSAGGSSQDVSGNRLADLNPEDIESIQVLKGPSAAAIYGGKANAGVVIITTKRGAEGATNVSVSQSIGFAEPLKLLGVASWNEEKIRNFYSGAEAETEVKKYKEAEAAGKLHDYEKVLYDHKRPTSKTNISISGGNSTTKFFVSGDYSAENGIITKTNFKRGSFRANLDQKISERIKISTSSYLSKTDNNRGFSGNQNRTGASVPYAVNFTPTYAQLFPDDSGNYPDNPYFGTNPLALANLAKNNQNVTRTIQSFNLNTDLYKNKGAIINFIVNGGVDYLDTRSFQYLPNTLQSQKTAENPGDVVHTKQDNLNTNLRGIFKYLQDIKAFSFSTQLGFVRSEQTLHRQQVRGRGLAPGQTNISQARVQSIPDQIEQQTIDIGWFGQEEINWGDRVIGTIGLRMDRSSLNYKQDHYYFFPKASIAANLTNFNFFKIDNFSQLKLRVAYGETGGNASYGSIYRALNSAHIGSRFGLGISSRDIDPNLTPERGKELEFGADIGFLSNRISFSITRYIKTISDLILDSPTAVSTGISAVATNAGTLQNKGIELGLTTIPFQSKKISWTSIISFWKNDSKITKLNIPPYTTGGYGVTLGNQLIQEGFSPTTIVSTPATPGKKSLYTIYGNAKPDFEMSFNESLSFLNGFQLNFLFHWSHGNYNSNLNPYHQDKAGTTSDYNTPEGEKRRNYTYYAESYIDDASFVRLKQVGLHYTVPSNFISKSFGSSIKRIRLGVAANDVYLFTNYPSYDVGASSFGTQAINQSTSNSPYPASRKILFNLDINF